MRLDSYGGSGGSDGEASGDEAAAPPEEWALCAPVLQVEGDGAAPTRFAQYVEMRLPHVAPRERLGDVVVDCYREDARGRKEHVRVPNKATVFEELPEVRAGVCVGFRCACV